MTKVRYTKEERELITSEKFTLDELIVMLGRTRKSIIAAKHNAKNRKATERHNWTAEDIELLKSKKFTVQELAVMLKVSEVSVRVRMCLHKLSPPRPRLITENIEAEIIFMRALGKTCKEISEKFNLSYDSVRWICRKNGLTKKRKN
ncbi:MAG: hypothetical protein ACRC0G_15850 [Fusobacteriaceae bacterium]